MPTTTIESQNSAAKPGKRARKHPTPTKAKPARASGNQRNAAPTTKTEQVLGLLRRARGASISDLSSATGWQAHSIRGFLPGTVKKKMGLAVVSEMDGKGIRRYRIAMDIAA
jgi:hypothetical protein